MRRVRVTDLPKAMPRSSRRTTDLADHGRTMVHHALTSPMQRLHILLLDGPLGYQRNMQFAYRQADRFGVIVVVLLPADEVLYILRADDLHLVPDLFKLPGPAKGASACLDAIVQGSMPANTDSS
jgi:hypothetical protein